MRGEPVDSWRGERYEARPPRGMAADQEEARIPPMRDTVIPPGSQWERGRDVEELAVSVSVPHWYWIVDFFCQTNHDSTSHYEEHRSRGAKGPSEPSRDVIFLGLDPELTENDVSC